MLTKSEVENLVEKFNDASMDLGSDRARIRSAYDTEVAREQLARLLVNCKVFSRVKNEQEMALHNLGISMLEDMGMLDIGNIESIVNMLLSLPLVNSGEKEEK